MDRVGIAFLRGLVDLRSARIAESDGPGDLVEGLSGRVIDGPAQDLEL